MQITLRTVRHFAFLLGVAMLIASAALFDWRCGLLVAGVVLTAGSAYGLLKG